MVDRTTIKVKGMTEQDLLNYSLQWDKAIASNDVKQMRSFMADDWVCVATDGGMTKLDDFLNEIETGDLIHTEMSTEESRVRVYGDSGIVTGKGHSKGSYKGKSFSFYEWSTSVFVFDGTRWRCVLTMLTGALSSKQ
jgi:ketosteroid isomerase-like protein